jgi:uncharacterized protein (TIGR03067 family)
MTRYLFLLIALWPPLAAGAPKAAPAGGEAARELARLQGKWRLAAEDHDGKVTKVATVRDGHIIAFEKDLLLEFTDEGKHLATKASLRLGPTRSPKTIDETIVYCPLIPSARGTTIRGIYQLEGDELKLALPCLPWGARPKAFTTRKGDRFMVVTYKRMKK